MSEQELAANKDELTQSKTTYDYWAINSALSLALAAEDHASHRITTMVEEAETLLLSYLRPQTGEGDLPAFLSPERRTRPTPRDYSGPSTEPRQT